MSTPPPLPRDPYCFTPENLSAHLAARLPSTLSVSSSALSTLISSNDLSGDVFLTALHGTHDIKTELGVASLGMRVWLWKQIVELRAQSVAYQALRSLDIPAQDQTLEKDNKKKTQQHGLVEPEPALIQPMWMPSSSSSASSSSVPPSISSSSPPSRQETPAGVKRKRCKSTNEPVKKEPSPMHHDHHPVPASVQHWRVSPEQGAKVGSRWGVVRTAPAETTPTAAAAASLTPQMVVSAKPKPLALQAAIISMKEYFVDGGGEDQNDNPTTTAAVSPKVKPTPPPSKSASPPPPHRSLRPRSLEKVITPGLLPPKFIPKALSVLNAIPIQDLFTEFIRLFRSIADENETDSTTSLLGISAKALACVEDMSAIYCAWNLGREIPVEELSTDEVLELSDKVAFETFHGQILELFTLKRANRGRKQKSLPAPLPPPPPVQKTKKQTTQPNKNKKQKTTSSPKSTPASTLNILPSSSSSSSSTSLHHSTRTRNPTLTTPSSSSSDPETTDSDSEVTSDLTPWNVPYSKRDKLTMQGLEAMINWAKIHPRKMKRWRKRDGGRAYREFVDRFEEMRGGIEEAGKQERWRSCEILGLGLEE